MQADILIINARVLPMTAPGVRAEAVAIAGDRLRAVGRQDDLAGLAGPGTTILDAGGGTVLPGFVESHLHIFPGAVSLDLPQLGGLKGEAALARVLRAHAAADPEAPLVLGQGVDYAVLGEGRALDRRVLDRILPDRPLALVSCDLHNVWANTAALRAAGLLSGRDVGSGAEVVMGPDGLATGLLREFAAYAPVLAQSRNGGRDGLGFLNAEPDGVTAEERAADLATLLRGLDHCAAQGITSIVNMDGNAYQLDLLAGIEATRGLPCRVSMPYHFTPGEPLGALDRAEAWRAAHTGPMLRVSHVKLFMDGVLDAATAFRLSDYPGRPGFRSVPLHDPGRFAAIATEADRRGLQIVVHAIGDAAVRTVLDGYAAARRANGPRDSRHRIEHIEMIHPDDIPRIAELGAVASLQPEHVPGGPGFPLEPTVSLIGRAEWSRAFLCRTLADAGAPICFASDWSVAALPPLRGIGVALGRPPWEAGMPDERLTVEETLAAYTSTGAWAAHLDGLTGRLEPGLAADLVLLDGDLEAALTGAAGMPNVAATICAGRFSYRR